MLQLLGRGEAYASPFKVHSKHLHHNILMEPEHFRDFSAPSSESAYVEQTVLVQAYVHEGPKAVMLVTMPGRIIPS